MQIAWMSSADSWLPANLRERFIETAQASRWVPVDGDHPEAADLMVKGVMPYLRDYLRIMEVSEVAYNQSWVLRDDDRLLKPEARAFVVRSTILGVQSKVDGIRFYFLDLGVAAIPLVVIEHVHVE